MNKKNLKSKKNKIKIAFEVILTILFIGLVYLDIQSDNEAYLKMILVGFIFIFTCYKYQSIKIHKFILLYIIYFLINLSSVFYSISNQFYFGNMAILISILLLLFSFPKIFDNMKNINMLLNSIVILGLILTLRIFTLIDFSTLLLGADYISGILQRGIGNRNIIAMLIALSFNVSSYQFFYQNKKYNVVIMSILLLVTLLTGSRKGLIFILIPFCINMVNIYFSSNRISIKFKYLLLALVGIMGMYYLLFRVEFIYLNLGIRLESAFKGIVLKQSVEEGSLGVRASMINIGLDAFGERPLFGYGLENFRYIYGSIAGGEGTYSHNNFIEILVNNGLIGFLAYYSFYISIIFSALRKGIASISLNERNYYIFIVSLLISMLIVDFTMVTYKWYPLYVIFILAMKPMNRIKSEGKLEKNEY